MKHFLTKAFTAAHDAAGYIFQKTAEIVDYANVMGVRLMTDRSFMRIDPKVAKNGLEKGALFVYEVGRQNVIKKVNGTIDNSFSNPHGAPKMSLKSVLKEAAEMAMPHLMKSNVLVPLVVGASVAVLGIMLYTLNTGHVPSFINDMLAPFIGTGNGSALRGGDVTPTPPEP